MLSRLRAWLRAIVAPGAVERDIDDELRYHLERDAESFGRQGLGAEEARRAALRAFGGVEPAREAMRDASAVRLLTDLKQDAAYALRMLRRDPALAIVATLTLALVIGANAAVFSVVNAVLLRPLSFPSADRLVVISEQTPIRPQMGVAYPDYRDWSARNTTFDSMGASIVIGGVLTGGGQPERVFGRAVTASFFRTLGVPLHAGRWFTDTEDRPGGERVVVLSHALWQRRYGADPSIVGRTVNYNGDPYAVIGVLPASFDYYGVDNANNDIFLPLGHLEDNDYMKDRDSHPVRVLGRMKGQATIDQARADLATIAASLALEHPGSNRGVGTEVRPLLDDYVGDVRLTLAVLLAAALLVLLVASANIANLLLARGSARRREIALRLALGAGRLRIMRQLITESLVLAVFGGALGVVVGTSAARMLDRLAPNSLPRLTDVQIDVRVVVFSIAVTVLAGLAFGAAPALQASGIDLRRFLGEGGRSQAPRARRMREVLAVTQMALCIALVVGAGLLVRSYSALLRADPGFDAHDVITMRIRLPDGRYRDRARVLSVLEQALTRIAGMRGVESAALATGVPLGRANDERYVVDGQAAPSRERTPVALVQWVTPGFHRTLRIGLLAGRYFTAADRENAADVAIVDEEFSARTFPGGNSAAIGRRVQLAGERGRWREIVGVVRHIRHAALDEKPRAEVYAPFDQMDASWQLEIGRAMDVAIRSRDGEAPVVAGVREQLRAIDPELPLSHVRTMDDALAMSMAPRTFTLTLLGLFAGVAVVLCVVGLYGVTSYAVTQRTREIGIRMALGARPGEVVALLMGRGAIVIAAGLVLGLAASMVCGRVLQDLLYGVRPRDPVTFGVAAGALCIVAAVASYLPARRATRLDPVAALRND